MKTMMKLALPDLMALYGLNRLRHGHGGGKAIAKAAAMALVMAYVVGVYLFGATVLLESMGLLSHLPVMTLLFTLLYSLLTTTFRVENLLFHFRGQDALRAMPVSTRELVGSRILVLTVYDALGEALFLLPMAAVYALRAQPGATAVILLLIVALLSPLLAVSAASVLGCLLLRVTARLKHNRAVNLAAGFAVFALSMGLGMGFNGAVAQGGASGLADFVRGAAGVFPLSLAHGAAAGSVACALGFALLCAACFALAGWFISRFYARLNAQLAPRVQSRRETARVRDRVRTPARALFAHECRRYFSLPVYVLNTGFGPVMMVGMTAALVILPRMDAQWAALNALIGGFVPGILALFALMSATTPCSISLEGKGLALLRAMPIKPGEYLGAKIALSLLVSAPAAAVCALALIFELGMSPLQGAATLVTPPVCALFAAVLGLYFNMKQPKMEWTNETAVVKQSMSVVCATFSSLFVALVVLALCLMPGALLALDAALLLAALALQRRNERRVFPALLRKLDA